METPPGHMYGVISWQSNANFMCIAHFPHISRKLVYIWKKEPNQKLCKPISDGWNFLDQGRNQTSRDARASQKGKILSWETRVRQTLVPSWAQVFAPKSREHDLEDNARLLSIVLQTYLNTTPTLTATGLLHSNPHSSRCPDSSHTQLTNCSYCLKLLFCKQDSAAWRREFQIFFMNILFFTVKMYSQMPHTYNARMDLNLPYADNELEHWAGQN